MGSPKLANENTQGGIFSIRTSPILQGTYLCPLLQGVEWMGSLRDTELSNRSHSRPEQAGQARTAGVCQDGENTADARERMRSEEKWAGETKTEEWAPDSPRAKHTEAGPCKKKKKKRKNPPAKTTAPGTSIPSDGEKTSPLKKPDHPQCTWEEARATVVYKVR